MDRFIENIQLTRERIKSFSVVQNTMIFNRNRIPLRNLYHQMRPIEMDHNESLIIICIKLRHMKDEIKIQTHIFNFSWMVGWFVEF